MRVCWVVMLILLCEVRLVRSTTIEKATICMFCTNSSLIQQCNDTHSLTTCTTVYFNEGISPDYCYPFFPNRCDLPELYYTAAAYNGKVSTTVYEDENCTIPYINETTVSCNDCKNGIQVQCIEKSVIKESVAVLIIVFIVIISIVFIICACGICCWNKRKPEKAKHLDIFTSSLLPYNRLVGCCSWFVASTAVILLIILGILVASTIWTGPLEIQGLKTLKDPIISCNCKQDTTIFTYYVPSAGNFLAVGKESSEKMNFPIEAVSMTFNPYSYAQVVENGTTQVSSIFILKANGTLYSNPSPYNLTGCITSASLEWSFHPVRNQIMEGMFHPCGSPFRQVEKIIVNSTSIEYKIIPNVAPKYSSWIFKFTNPSLNKNAFINYFNYFCHPVCSEPSEISIATLGNWYVSALVVVFTIATITINAHAQYKGLGISYRTFVGTDEKSPLTNTSLNNFVTNYSSIDSTIIES